MIISFDGKLKALKDDSPKELYIDCDSICLRQKSINLEIQIPTEKIKQFDTIILNGIRYTKETAKMSYAPSKSPRIAKDDRGIIRRICLRDDRSE